MKVSSGIDGWYLRGMIFWDQNGDEIGRVGELGDNIFYKVVKSTIIYLEENEKLLGF